jgi:uncharacterized protein YfaP (DUF2135 family)
MVFDPKVNLTVEWFLGARVLFENGSLPVEGAVVNFTNAKNVQVASVTTGPDGSIGSQILEEYTASSHGNNDKSPYNISTLKDQRTNYTANVNLDHSQDLTLFIDDISPMLEVLSPANNTLTNQTRILVKGRSETNCEVLVNGIQASNNGGDWSAIVDLTNEGPNKISIVAYDRTLNQARQSLTVFRDTIAPELDVTSPKNDFLTNQSSILVSGRTSDITANTTINGLPVIVGSDGIFNIIYNLTEGQNTIAIESRDAAQNRARVVMTGERDSVPPELTVFYPANGLATTEDSINIKGYAEPGCTLTMNGRFVALDKGSFTVQVMLDEGDNIFIFIAKDKAGNTNAASLLIIKDTKPPGLEISYPRDGELLNQRVVNVQGTTEPGAKLRVDGVLIGLNGSAFCATVVLAEGPNTITVEAMDALRNAVQKNITVTVDTVPPSLYITSPANRTLTNLTMIGVGGKTEPGASVMVDGFNVTVEHDGTFTFNVNLSNEGANFISIQARDAAWNIVEKHITIFRDTVLYYNITSPQNNITVKAGNIIVAGNAELGAIVIIENVTVPLNDDGTFSKNMILDYGLNRIHVTITDKAGNSASETLTVTRAKPSSKPSAHRFIPGFEALGLLAASVGAALLLRSAELSRPADRPARRRRGPGARR